MRTWREMHFTCSCSNVQLTTHLQDTSTMLHVTLPAELHIKMLDHETWSDTRTKRAHHNLVAGQTSDPKLQSHSVKHCLDGLKKWRHSHTNHKMQSFCWYALSSDLFHFPLVGLIWKYTKLLLNYLTLSLPKANFTKPRKVLNAELTN